VTVFNRALSSFFPFSSASSTPFAPFEWFLAFRYLRARRRESFISVISMFSLIGIALGVATLIIVMSVMNGFRAELIDRVLGFNGHVKIYAVSDDKLYQFDPLAADIRAIDGVMRAAPLVEGQAMASAGDWSSGVAVRGLRERDLRSLTLLSDNILGGTIDNFDAGGGIVIGERLASQLRVRLGDAVTLISPKGAITPFGITPRIKSYPVTAIYKVGMSEYDGTFVFMPLGEAQLYFNKGEEAVSSLEIMIEDPDRVTAIRRSIEQTLTKPLLVVDWRQMNSTFFGVLEVERNVMFLILTLIIVVAAFNIISGLIMLVKDKGQDIAILRSMGVTKGAVMRIFFVTGSSIGVIGTLAGFLLGVLVTLNIEAIRQGLQALLGFQLFPAEIYYLSKLPAVMDPGEVLSVVLMALALSFLATLYPSWRAARLDPVEALRYE